MEKLELYMFLFLKEKQSIYVPILSETTGIRYFFVPQSHWWWSVCWVFRRSAFLDTQRTSFSKCSFLNRRLAAQSQWKYRRKASRSYARLYTIDCRTVNCIETSCSRDKTVGDSRALYFVRKFIKFFTTQRYDDRSVLSIAVISYCAHVIRGEGKRITSRADPPFHLLYGEICRETRVLHGSFFPSAYRRKRHDSDQCLIFVGSAWIGCVYMNCDDGALAFVFPRNEIKTKSEKKNEIKTNRKT